MDARANTVHSPEQVSAAIAEALERDDRVRGSGLQVHTLAGSWGFRIRLQGRVPTWDARLAAERCAWAIPGVSGVDNALIVASGSGV